MQIKQLAPAPAGSGFIALFNGKDLYGWKPHPFGKASWEVENGILTGRGGVGHLFHLGTTVENFHLRVEAMINDGGNSGVYFRTPFGTVTPQGYPQGGYEAQINSSSLTDPRKTGSLFIPTGVAVNVKQTPVLPNEWFTLEVIAEGPHLIVKVNGQPTADYVDWITRSRFGQIALQVLDAATVVKFRKIEIKSLPPGDLRLTWVHSRGEFEHVNGKVWLERVDNAVKYWWEAGRSADLIDLRLATPDPRANNAIIHLRPTNAHLTTDGGKHWQKVWDGSWQVLEPLPTPERSPAARIGEWVSLLRSTDLAEWRSTPGTKPGSWKYDGDALVCQSDVATGLSTRRENYENFHLRFETQLPDAKQNAFLLIRCGLTSDDGGGSLKSYGIRIGETADGSGVTSGVYLHAYKAAMPLHSAKPAVPQKFGQWFPVEVLAEGNRMRVLVSGKLVADYKDVNETFTTGRIMLLCFPKEVARFRKLEIKELPPALSTGER
jgi:hypothetical protein